MRIEVGDFSGFSPARMPRHLPVVLSVQEVQRLLAHMTSQHWLIAALLYGAGLHVTTHVIPFRAPCGIAGVTVVGRR